MFGFVFLINMPWVPLLVGFGSMCHLDRWRNVEGHSEGIFLGKERRIDCVSRSEVWMSIVAPGLKSGEEVGERLLSCPEQRKLRERVEGGRCRLKCSSLDFLSSLFPMSPIFQLVHQFLILLHSQFRHHRYPTTSLVIISGPHLDSLI